MAVNSVKYIPGGIGVPKNLIFLPSEYNLLGQELKVNYKSIGKNTWALAPSQMRVDKSRLPRYLSTDQYNFFKAIVEQYYRPITRGFGPEKVQLYGLKPSYLYDEKMSEIGTKIPYGARITEEQFYALPAKYKVYYTRAESRGKAYYYKSVSEKMPKLARQVNAPEKSSRQESVVRTPTVGIRVAPMGRWLDRK